MKSIFRPAKDAEGNDIIQQKIVYDSAYVPNDWTDNINDILALREEQKEKETREKEMLDTQLGIAEIYEILAPYIEEKNNG